MSTEPNAIVAEHLRRVYVRSGMFGRNKREVVAVDDISFSIPRGTIFGMLGPNGAGKTTTIKMLSTLLIPTSGSATVGGHDIVREEGMVRRLLGVVLGVVLGGDRGLYAKLSGWDNLIYFGTLYGLRKGTVERRADEVLQMVNLRDRAEERVEGYSRGMKQRMHLAKALLHDPPILFLDEPTIGLDPAAAHDLRQAIAGLVPDHTVLLTTHDMFEADTLCREIAIVDKGLIVAQGTPGQLKERVADTRRIVVSTPTALDGRRAEIEMQVNRLPGVRGLSGDMTDADMEWTILCEKTATTLDSTLHLLRQHGVPIGGVRVIEPTLEDAFLSIAGRSFE
ncbi:MAG: ATP-binding cassette domain-containing protein [Chloroflexota bacterium]|nr:ATP-binding cassette domain-containing protein [Chloroflexota bacterium]